MLARNFPTNTSPLQVFEDKASKFMFAACQSFSIATYIYQEMGEQNQFPQFSVTHSFVFTTISYPITLILRKC